MRHLIILDFRKEEEITLEGKIRKSVRTDLENYKLVIVSSLATHKEECKSHFELDDLKRVLLIFPKDNWRGLEKRISAELEALGNQIL